jgi:hypothetical protein
VNHHSFAYSIAVTSLGRIKTGQPASFTTQTQIKIILFIIRESLFLKEKPQALYHSDAKKISFNTLNIIIFEGKNQQLFTTTKSGGFLKC